MAKKHKLLPREEQDRFERGFLKTDQGAYIPISRYTIIVNDAEVNLSGIEKQDQLEAGLLKLKNGEYIGIEISEKSREGADKVVIDCFVATAVYGDRNASQVETLREFRDEVLKPSAIGNAFVRLYYSGIGRKAADFIQNHLPSTIPVIRRGLDVLVERYSAQRK